MENTKYASQNMPIPGSAQLFTQKKNAMTAFVCSWNLRVSCQLSNSFLVLLKDSAQHTELQQGLGIYSRTLAVWVKAPLGLAVTSLSGHNSSDIGWYARLVTCWCGCIPLHTC